MSPTTINELSLAASPIGLRTEEIGGWMPIYALLHRNLTAQRKLCELARGGLLARPPGKQRRSRHHPGYRCPVTPAIPLHCDSPLTSRVRLAGYRLSASTVLKV